MILARLTREAEAATARYGMLTDAWRSIFHANLNSPRFGTPGALDEAVSEAFVVAQHYLSTEDGVIERTAAEIAVEARVATKRALASIDTSELSDAALEHLGATENYIHSELVAQIHRDIALLRQSIQRVALEVSIAARARGISQRVALIEYRIGNHADLQFMFHDRHARKWASKKFVRAMFRHAMLGVYNESVLITLSEHGVARARIVHTDPKAEVHGMILALGSNTDRPTYSEIRNEIFHPNADAILAAPEATDVQT